MSVISRRQRAGYRMWNDLISNPGFRRLFEAPFYLRVKRLAIKMSVRPKRILVIQAIYLLVEPGDICGLFNKKVVFIFRMTKGEKLKTKD